MKNNDECVELFLVPHPFVQTVLQSVPSHILGAQLRKEKTLDRIKAQFYWPGVKRAVEDYCCSSSECQ